MSIILVIAPHPDDETLGCGGALLRHISIGDLVHWVIVSTMDPSCFSAEQIDRRSNEINQVASAYGFASITNLRFNASRLDDIPVTELVDSIGDVISQLRPETIYLPFPGDAHTDHRAVYLSAISATKWFRYPFVKRILACEIVSETDFGLNPEGLPFRPNLYINISDWIEKKIEIMRLYESEIGEHPFPRSAEVIRALARLRGAQSGFLSAEAFMVVKEIIG